MKIPVELLRLLPLSTPDRTGLDRWARKLPLIAAAPPNSRADVDPSPTGGDQPRRTNSRRAPWLSGRYGSPRPAWPKTARARSRAARRMNSATEEP